MINTMKARHGYGRSLATLIVSSLILPLVVGCGGPSNTGANAPPIDDTQGGRASAPPPAQPQQHTGLSTKQKVVLVAGAAALYWLYKHHQDAQGKDVQYYQSKNGRIYYRDANHQAHWVTPPTQVTVTPEEEQEMSQYQGYNNSNTGRQFTGFQQESGQ